MSNLLTQRRANLKAGFRLGKLANRKPVDAEFHAGNWRSMRWNKAAKGETGATQSIGSTLRWRLSLPCRANRISNRKAGPATEVVQTFDSTALDPDSLEHKFYAPGIGKIATQSLVDGMSIGGEELRLFVVPEPVAGTPAMLAIGSILLTVLRRKRSVAFRS